MRKTALAFCAVMLVAGMLFAGCGPTAPQTNGYKNGVEPGMSKQQVEAVFGPPTNQGEFDVGTVKAYYLTYPFGQVLLEGDRAATITVTDSPAYVGPFGIRLGMQESAMIGALKAGRAHHTGHRDEYNVVTGDVNTRTRDYYDQTDHLMIELAAANPNDPLAPFNVISITRANDKGLAMMEEITKAKMGGLYPDQHVLNFISEPWKT